MPWFPIDLFCDPRHIIIVPSVPPSHYSYRYQFIKWLSLNSSPLSATASSRRQWLEPLASLNTSLSLWL
jgi:hypothetical protein